MCPVNEKLSGRFGQVRTVHGGWGCTRVVKVGTRPVRSMTMDGFGRAIPEGTDKSGLTGDGTGEGQQGGWGGAGVQWRPRLHGGGGIQWCWR